MRNFRRITFSLLITLVFWPGFGHGATLTFGSDQSWSVYDDYPTMPGASLLGQATPYCGVIFFGCAFPTLPGAQPVWAPGITGATDGDLAEFFFAKTIFVPGSPTAAEITVSVDDLAEIFVNGTSVGSLGSITDVSQSTRDPETFDISSLLQSGDNLIVVRAQNGPGSFAGCNPCTYSQNGASIVFAGEVTFTSTGCLPAPSGLVSWWPAEGSADDIAGANDGALTAGVGFTTGRVGQAFSFTSISFGGTGVVTVPHSASIDFPVADSFTVEAWLNETVIGGHILGKRPGGACTGNTGFYQMAVGTGSFPSALIGTNVWRHIATTWDGSTLRQFIDGVETTNGTYTPGSNTDPLTFGTSGACNGFHGALDEVSIYDRALSITEIQSIFGVGSFGKCAPTPTPTDTPTGTQTGTPTSTPTATATSTPTSTATSTSSPTSTPTNAPPDPAPVFEKLELVCRPLSGQAQRKIARHCFVKATLSYSEIETYGAYNVDGLLTAAKNGLSDLRNPSPCGSAVITSLCIPLTPPPGKDLDEVGSMLRAATMQNLGAGQLYDNCDNNSNLWIQQRLAALGIVVDLPSDAPTNGGECVLHAPVAAQRLTDCGSSFLKTQLLRLFLLGASTTS